MSRYRASCRTLDLAAAVAVSVAVIIVVSMPFERTMPVYLELAGQLERGQVPQSFEPLGYSWLIALIPGAALDRSAKILHLLAYALLALLVVGQGRQGLQRVFDGGGPHQRVSAAAIVLLCLLVLFNPYILVNLVRLNDNSVAVLLVVTMFVMMRPAGDSWRRVPLLAHGALAGSCLGLVAFVRPNAICVVPALWVALGRNRAAAAVAMTATYALLAALAAGHPGFWPGNGAYNLFAGNNPAALDAVMREYNAEPSLAEGLSWCGVNELPRAVPAAQYLECTARFIGERPLDAVTVSAAKFYNMLFRPNLRLADSPFEVIVQWSMLGLPLLWWTATGVVFVRSRRLVDPSGALFVALYALPFIVSNSDPRFRLPLDAVYAVSLISSVPTLAAFLPAASERASSAA